MPVSEEVRGYTRPRETPPRSIKKKVGKHMEHKYTLKDKIKEFLTNPTNDPNLPARELKDIEGFGEYAVSQGVISLQNDRSTSYSQYIAVQNELAKAINELRDEFAFRNYGKNFASLTSEQQDIVQEAVPQLISEAEPVDVTRR